MMDLLGGSMSLETARLRGRMEVLTRQAASGQRAEVLGDIAPEVPRALALRAEMDRRETYSRAMSQAGARADVTQTALGRLTDLAREFRTGPATRISGSDPTSLLTVPERARSAIREVAALLNTRHAGEYVFSGSDLARPPVPAGGSLDSGPMATQIAAEVATLGGGNAAAVATATLGIAASTSAGTTPFSAHLEGAGATEPRRGVPSGDGEVIGVGVFGNRNTAAGSTGETTGAWARDLLRGLMSLAALTPAQLAASPSDVDALMRHVRDGLQAAETALGEEAGALGQVQARLDGAQRRHAQVNDTLRAQLGDIQEVDLAETLTRLQSTRATLEASYRAMGSLSDLSLAKFLR